jgi:septal ring factor EnvC (AmiA/AmiB activator)
MEQNGVVGRGVIGTSTCDKQDLLHHDVATHHATPTGKTKYRAMLWGAGGTLLSVVGFIALALFEQYNSMLAELRRDLKHFNETSGEYVKKESVQKYKEQMRECLKEIQASNAARAQLEQELKASEKTRDQLLHEVQRMAERLAYIEGRQAAPPTNNSNMTTEK